MEKNNHQVHIRWEKDQVPVSSFFDDAYYHDEDGVAETREVYLAGNGLPDRWELCKGNIRPFCIGELGFGVGLNFLVTLHSWLEHGPSDGGLHFVSFEQYLPSLADCRRAWSRWPQIQRLGDQILGHKWTAAGHEEADQIQISFPGGELHVFIGDANKTLPLWPGRADAWYLDGFSPAKNPQLWQDDLLKMVASKSAPEATFSTFTSVGQVRRSLQGAGFDVQKVKGFGRKRHRLQGRLAP